MTNRPPEIEAALDKILKWEGPRSDDAGDPGGLTIWGVSARWARDLRLDLDGDGDTDRQDLERVTPAIAKDLFADAFWRRPRIDRLPLMTQPVMIQFAVNCGAPRAIMELQKLVDEVPDGVIGPATLRAAEAWSSRRGGVNALVDAQIAYYRRLVALKPVRAKFLQGWINRANDFRPRGSA